MTEPISSDAVIGDGVTIGLFTVIHPGVVIGKGSMIGAFCELGSPDGSPLVLGGSSVVRSYTNIQGGSTFGEELQTGQYTMIRGGMAVGRNLHVGSNCELQGDIRIGDFVRIQSGVHLGKRVQIGDLVWIFPNVLTVNDPLPPSAVHLPQVFQRLSCVAANVLLMPGVTIGEGAFVAASSVVRADVRPISCVSGDPAREFTTIDRLVAMEHGLKHPWPSHFRRGYPPEADPMIEEALLQVAALVAEERQRRAARRSKGSR